MFCGNGEHSSGAVTNCLWQSQEASVFQHGKNELLSTTKMFGDIVAMGGELVLQIQDKILV